MTTPVIQPSFASGELSPSLFARVDLAKFHIGAAKLRNFFVDYRGGVSNRPGTVYVGRCKYSNRITRLIPFQFNQIQTYALEFGDFYMRVIMDGGYVLESTKAITGITQANPAVVTSAGHGYSNGDWVYITAVTGMTQVNDKVYQIAGVTANTFQLQTLSGVNVNSSAYTAYSAGGTVARVFTLTTPYSQYNLDILKFTQSNDVMTLVHPDFAPRDLTRTGHASWTLTTITFASTQAAPTGLAVASSDIVPNTTEYSYKVTAVSAAGEESLPTAAVSVGADSFNLVTMYNTISWLAASGAVYYNVYRAPWVATTSVPSGAIYGFIGSTAGLSLKDNNITADYSITPPANTDPFAGSNYPSTVCYFQQRKWFAGSTANPQTMWATQTALFKNMDASVPIRATDAIVATLVAQQVNNIVSMIPMPGGLIVLTGAGAWQVSGDGNGSPITPVDFTAQAQAYNGASDVPPIITNFDILYVQAKGSIVRDLSYNFYMNIYTGTDMTVLSNHLFLGHEIVDWAFAEEPHKLLWAVRDDGILLCLTFLKEQDVYAWSHCDTFGLYKSVCTISEGNEDAVYFVVKRYINGEWVQMVERLQSRDLSDGVESAWFVDCGLQYPLTYPAAQLTPSDITGTVIFTADTAIFSSGNVGDVIRVGGGIATVTAYTDTTHVTGTFSQDMTNYIEDANGTTRPIPAESGEWSMTTPVTTVTGLDHLEGMTVAIFGDGNVFPSKVVTNGAVTLNHASSNIVVGLPYKAQFQSLYLDVGEPTVQSKRKRIVALTARVQDSRGLWMGPDFDSLVPHKDRSSEPLGEPIQLFTGDQRMIIAPTYNQYGQVCIELRDPLPATILGIIPEVVIGDVTR